MNCEPSTLEDGSINVNGDNGLLRSQPTKYTWRSGTVKLPVGSLCSSKKMWVVQSDYEAACYSDGSRRLLNFRVSALWCWTCLWNKPESTGASSRWRQSLTWTTELRAKIVSLLLEGLQYFSTTRRTECLCCSFSLIPESTSSQANPFGRWRKLLRFLRCLLPWTNFRSKIPVLSFTIQQLTCYATSPLTRSEPQ